MKKEKITKDMLIGDLVEKYPDSGMILFKYGMHCIGCRVSLMETIEQGCQVHGMDNETIDKMVEELNDMASRSEVYQKPPKDEAARIVSEKSVKRKVPSKKASAKHTAKTSNKKPAKKRSKK